MTVKQSSVYWHRKAEQYMVAADAARRMNDPLTERAAAIIAAQCEARALERIDAAAKPRTWRIIDGSRRALLARAGITDGQPSGKEEKSP